VSAANPGDTALIEVGARGAGDGQIASLSQGYRPLRGLQFVWYRLPGVRSAHPGLYAIVRSADWLVILVGLRIYGK